MDEWDPVTQQLIYNIQLIGEDANDDGVAWRGELDVMYDWSGTKEIEVQLTKDKAK